jgi:hypothetical protein
MFPDLTGRHNKLFIFGRLLPRFPMNFPFIIILVLLFIGDLLEIIYLSKINTLTVLFTRFRCSARGAFTVYHANTGMQQSKKPKKAGAATR